MRASVLVGTAICCAGFAAVVAAQVTSEDPASIIVFPKIVADGQRDTFVQITNVSSMATSAHCVYVDTAGACTVDGMPCAHTQDCAQGPGPNQCHRIWQSMDFDLQLSAAQPTNWVVSRGRPATPVPRCSPGNPDCYGAGPDALPIVPVQPGFSGELLCVETALDGSPVIRNGLVGVATVEDPVTGDVGKYNAIGLPGQQVSDDNVLVLGQEYAGCPQSWILEHAASGAEDGVAGPGSSVLTTLTLVPCAHDFVNQAPASPNVVIQVTNEFEQVFSSSISFTGYEELPLADIGATGTSVVTSRISSTATSSGLLLVAEERRHTEVPSDLTTTSLVNLHHEGVRSQLDEIHLEQILAPVLGPPPARLGAAR